MGDRVAVGNLRVARPLYDFITDEALPGTGINPDSFWSGVDKVECGIHLGGRLIPAA